MKITSDGFGEGSLELFDGGISTPMKFSIEPHLTGTLTGSMSLAKISLCSSFAGMGVVGSDSVGDASDGSSVFGGVVWFGFTNVSGTTTGDSLLPDRIHK